MTKDEALKPALEALEVAEHFVEEYAASKYYFAHVAAITAIKEYMAQPEQEPVQFKCTVIDDVHPNGIPLKQWTSPPAQRTWVGLTFDEMPQEEFGNVEFLAGARWAARKLKERNT